MTFGVGYIFPNEEETVFHYSSFILIYYPSQNLTQCVGFLPLKKIKIEPPEILKMWNKLCRPSAISPLLPQHNPRPNQENPNCTQEIERITRVDHPTADAAVMLHDAELEKEGIDGIEDLDTRQKIKG